MGFDVGTYLKALGHHGPAAPTLETLRSLHHRHLRTFPYDSALNAGRGAALWAGVDIDRDAAFDEIVAGGGGRRCGPGWQSRGPPGSGGWPPAGAAASATSSTACSACCWRGWGSTWACPARASARWPARSAPPWTAGSTMPASVATCTSS